MTLLLHAINENDPVVQAMFSFIITQVTYDQLAVDGPLAIRRFKVFLARFLASGRGLLLSSP